MNVLFYISVLLTSFYTLLILFYWIGWSRIKEFVVLKTGNEKNSAFSILIPARNEAHAIAKCLQDIFDQDYPVENFEVIVINDHSTDGTNNEVERFIEKKHTSNVKLLQMHDDPEKRKLKKAAITFGISRAKNKFIILTDADCERGKEWLFTIDRFLDQTKSKMVYAPVEFKAHTIFEKIQAMEFAGLVGIGAAAIELKNPNMCSAANLIFEKTVFDEVEGYKGYDGLASGDDEFLMHKVFKMYPGDVHFLKNPNAIVYTSANVSLEQLTDQRRRWVSKSTKYGNRYITAILAGAYLFNASIVINLFMDFKSGIIQLIIKTVIEFLFLIGVLRFFRQKNYLLFLPLAELFHILYVLVIGIWANTGTYTWKGRQVK
ncbi:MAG: glycosyltransferase [Bacteroidia bacterium]